MTVSNPFTVRIIRNTELGQVAATLTQPYTFSAPLTVPTLNQYVARLDPANADGQDWPDSAGGTTTLGTTVTRAWIWGSRFIWDSTTRRALAINSPANMLSYGYRSMLSVYHETENTFRIYEDPFGSLDATWPRSVGHLFDNQCIRGRVLYKWTAPRFVSGYVQPQLTKINLDAITDDVTSAREGAAYLGSIGVPLAIEDGLPEYNITAPALDYLPGCDRIVMFHKKYLWFLDPVSETWSAGVDLLWPPTFALGEGDVWPFHNVGHYHPNVGRFVCGGGAYNPDGPENHRYQLQWVSVDGTTQARTTLDNSPVIMSVSETDMPTALEPPHLVEAKACGTYDPNSTESIYFHDNGWIYGLDTTRPAGSHWRAIMQKPIPEEVDWCCAIPEYGCLLTGHYGTNGTSKLRLFRGA